MEMEFGAGPREDDSAGIVLIKTNQRECLSSNPQHSRGKSGSMVLALGRQREARPLKLLASHLVNQQVQGSAGDPDSKSKLENDKRGPQH